MKIMTPEEVLKKPNPPIRWHHGTCDLCGGCFVPVCHFGYNTQPHSYRICKNCISLNLSIILYGKDAYNDGLVDSAAINTAVRRSKPEVTRAKRAAWARKPLTKAEQAKYKRWERLYGDDRNR